MSDMSDMSDMGGTWMNFRLRADRKTLQDTVSLIESIISNLSGTHMKAVKSKIEGIFPYYKYAIIDLEGDPPKLFGLIISNNVYQLIITDEKYIDQFYTAIWKILHVLLTYYLFTFSNHETRFFKKILPYKLRLADDENFLKPLKIINVQKRDFEGLVPALYSLDETSYPDPLLRNSKKVELHFKQKNYYLILEHNKSCLLSTLKIVQKRYLKLHLI